MSLNNNPWCLYLLRCADNSIYTGISINVEARVKKHNLGKGASFTSGRRPVSLIYQEEHPDQSSARRREEQIKNWGKADSIILATAKTHNAKVVTGDEQFRTLNSVMIR